jgi:hypothetical protein
MKAAGLLLLGGIIAMTYWAAQAQALPQFKNAFKDKYVENSTSQAFKDAFKTEGCNVCHVKGDSNKAHRNAYGKALAKFTGGSVAKDIKAAKANGGDSAAKDVLDKALKALDEGFDKVAEEKSASGKTYGELIKDGKLPNSK